MAEDKREEEKPNKRRLLDLAKRPEVRVTGKRRGIQDRETR